MTHRPFRWSLAAPLIEPRLGELEHPVGCLNLPPFGGDHFDHREPTFGLICSLSRSTARCAIASSFSSSAILYLAATRSLVSFVLGPGTSPRYVWFCLRHEQIV